MNAIPHPSSFEKLHVRYRLKADLVAVTGLRVGAGKAFDAAATNQPVIRDALGRPYIPGSSLKGSLRSGLETILRGLGSQYLWACELFDQSCVGQDDKDNEQAGRQGYIPLDEVLQQCCTACSLFGSPFLAGRVFIHDLPMLSRLQTEVRDGVGIHRDLGTAQQGIKYDVEVVPTGSRFQLEMVLENVDPDRLALVLQTLDLLNQGEILLGGLTTRGLGKVRLEKLSLEKTDAQRLLARQGFEALNYEAQLNEAGERLVKLLTESQAES